ncbi:MAG: hypothetical protein Q9219_006932 [cf. Caloplaca sp. 3 TL-2023]
MGLRRMPWDEWIELDKEFPDFHAEKSRRIGELGNKIAYTAPEGLNGAYELLEEFRDYLPQRYPSLFAKTLVGIDNLLTGERFNTTERPLKQDPMQIAARLVQDDLVITIEKPDGQYYLFGGAVTVPGTWCLEERLGMPLSQIHVDKGKVPGFREKLERGVMNLFRRIQPENPVQRNTWYVIGHDAISEDGFTLGVGKMNMPVENFLFRTERQTLRRLPRSGAVAFHFRTYSVPILDIVKEPYVPGRLASAIRSWDDETAKYKGRYTFDELLRYLDEKHNEQLANGLDLTKEDEYPHRSTSAQGTQRQTFPLLFVFTSSSKRERIVEWGFYVHLERINCTKDWEYSARDLFPTPPRRDCDDPCPRIREWFKLMALRFCSVYGPSIAS